MKYKIFIFILDFYSKLILTEIIKKIHINYDYILFVKLDYSYLDISYLDIFKFNLYLIIIYTYTKFLFML